MANLKTDEIKSWPIPVTPFDTQRGALQWLVAETDAVARLKRLILLQLDTLAERRQALITAAVTGQLDVTTARGANLP